MNLRFSFFVTIALAFLVCNTPLQAQKDLVPFNYPKAKSLLEITLDLKEKEYSLSI